MDGLIDTPLALSARNLKSFEIEHGVYIIFDIQST